MEATNRLLSGMILQVYIYIYSSNQPKKTTAFRAFRPQKTSCQKLDQASKKLGILTLRSLWARISGGSQFGVTWMKVDKKSCTKEMYIYTQIKDTFIHICEKKRRRTNHFPIFFCQGIQGLTTKRRSGQEGHWKMNGFKTGEAISYYFRICPTYYLHLFTYFPVNLQQQS